MFFYPNLFLTANLHIALHEENYSDISVVLLFTWHFHNIYNQQ